MSTAVQYRAKYDFVASGKGMLSFKLGDQFSLVSKNSDSWWTVKSAAGDMGLAPATYLQPSPEKDYPVKGPSYVALYDFMGQDATQLNITKGEMLVLVNKTDVSWWSMRNSAGEVGLVPVNYIDKLEETDTGKEKSVPQDQVQENGGDEALAEVLLSIDRAMQKIHDESVLQGGVYTSEQKTALKSLALHRKTVLEEDKTLNHTKSSPSKSSSSNATTKQSSSSPSISNHSPSRARRQAPRPPTQVETKASSAKSSTSSNGMEVARKDSSTHNRLSLEVETSNFIGDPRPRFGSLPRRAAPPPPSKTDPTGSPPKTGSSPTKTSKDGFSTLPIGKPPKYPSSSDIVDTSSFTTFSTFKTSPQSSHSHLQVKKSSPLTARRYSEDAGRLQKQSSTSLSSSGPIRRARSGSIGTPESQRRTQSSSSPGTARQPSSSASNSPKSPRKHSFSDGPSPGSSPRRQRSSEGDVIPLSTSFSSKDGGELVEVVRTRTGMSYRKSLLAVGGVLEFLKTRVPVCTDMVDSLLSAVQQSQLVASPSTSHKLDGSKDLERLKEIFFELQECKDDSQQRGWAVHDDQQIIMEYLEELLQILCDADPDITKVAVKEDKYENILTLITYYQMESRVPIRLLLLKVFGVLCGLDKTVISVLLTSVLPNELGRDIQQNLTDIQKTLYSSTVCTMIFSTAEAVPLPVYDQWSEEYVLFLLDTIESPPEEDDEEQIADAFLNIILAFNQHFQDPSTNLVMKALQERSNPRNFSEKLMFLVNREEDPVAITEPCCPNSLTKFLLDLFADCSTSGLFYTTDMMVLIDIVTRQLSDLGPGEETRTHYLELLYRIVNSTDYRDHKHRQKDISTCLNRIAQEETQESERDHEVIRKLWVTFPGIFEEVTDL